MLGCEVDELTADAMQKLLGTLTKAERARLSTEQKMDREDRMRGVLRVAYVTEGGPADNSGLAFGDQLISIDGRRIISRADLAGLGKGAAAGNGWTAGQAVRIIVTPRGSNARREVELVLQGDSDEAAHNIDVAASERDIVWGDRLRVGGSLGVVLIGLLASVVGTLIVGQKRTWWRDGFEPPEATRPAEG
jgi:C-terminal processing protease CtpA/Prc